MDGEAWIQPPGMVRIIHKNRMQMLYRNRALEESLKQWEEKQKHNSGTVHHEKSRLSIPRQSVPGEKSLLGIPVIDRVRQHSFSGAFGLGSLEKSPSICIERPANEVDLVFSNEEHYLLLSFIECTTCLTKWVKMVAINHNLEMDLYSLAGKTEVCLDKIHPNGKILEGPGLRIEFTKLVDTVKQLYEECFSLLHDKDQHKLKIREDLENKLSASLTNMEMELRKCYILEMENGNMVFLNTTQEDQVLLI